MKAAEAWLRLSGKSWLPVAFRKVFPPWNSTRYPVDDPEVLTAALNPQHLVFSEAFQLPFVDSAYLSNEQPLRKIFANHEKRLVERSIDAPRSINCHDRSSSTFRTSFCLAARKRLPSPLE